MSTLREQIAEKFLAALAESDLIEPEKREQLRALLASGKKLKSDDLVKIFATPVRGELK